ncbi:hypothetical protein ACWC4J_13050 [Streptomyces sp. NPDC001356]
MRGCSVHAWAELRRAARFDTIQLWRAPARLGAVRGSVGDDVQAAGVFVERYGLDVTGELRSGRGEDVVELREDAAAGAGASMPRSVIIIMLIALPSPSGSRPSRRTTAPVRRFGYF